jgi:DNA-binding IscR family transcriptional regulator
VRESLDRSKHLFREWLALASLAEIARRHIAGTRPWEAEELAAFLGVSSLGNLVEEFVSAGILLRAAEPEGIALARPPETVTVKEILDIVTGTDIEEMKTAGPVADALIHRDQAVQKALEGMTLKSLGAEPQAKTLRFAQFPAR